MSTLPQRCRAGGARLLLSCLLLAGFSLPAAAVEPVDTFSVRVSGYVTQFDTTVRANGEGQRGTDIDLNNDLGLDSDNIIALVGLTWRPFEHHEFGFSYYQDDYEAARVLRRDIDFDGTIYPASATVRADYSLDTYELNYIWWVGKDDNWALGPRLGLVWYKIDLGLAMELDVNGNPGSAEFNEDVSADLPAPSIGASWRWTPAQDWRLSAEAGYFTVDINDIDADVTFFRAGVEWYPWERFGFLLDYTFNDIDATVDRNSFNGRFEFEDSGLRVGAVYRF